MTGKGASVLCVDDDERIHKIVQLHLKKAGFQVLSARNGEEALENVKKTRPDLILLDVMMPGMNGFDVCSRLQRDKSTAYIPVIFSTALGEERDKTEAFAVGAVDYIVKPFGKEALLEKVRQHLKTQSQWQAFSRSGDEKESGVGDDEALAKDFREFRDILYKQLALSDGDRERIGVIAAENLYDRCGDLGIKPRDMAQHMADFLAIAYVSHVNPKDIMLGTLPTPFCRANKIVAVSNAMTGLGFVVSNPFDISLRDVLQQFTERGQPFKLSVTEPENVEWIFRYQEGAALDKLKEENKLVAATKESSDEQQEEVGPEDLAASAEEAPVVRLANSLIVKAIMAGASDIHLEPRENSLGVRYRIDGILQEQDPVPRKFLGPLVSRLKIMAEMDISERRVPQDGSVRIFHRGRGIDLRISTLPSRYGEKVVTRVLDKSTVSLDFDSLGYEKAQMDMMREAIRKPNGVMLITGPTGSGKTTALYTALQALNEPSRNIVTVEDPVEYDLHRVTQVQVNPAAGLTFPAALRSILRQDPDVIMVGEIRDTETLDIAIKAALTGHLVLSTLHTNDAPSTIIRLVDMAEPYLVATALEMVAAQRLIRRLCPDCKKPQDVPVELLERHGLAAPDGAQFYRAMGCETCSKTGFKGRTAIAEIMMVDDELRRMISRGEEISRIREHAVKSCGMVTLQQDAFAKAIRGLTSMEEVMRVTG